jgi:hypothetical protein
VGPPALTSATSARHGCRPEGGPHYPGSSVPSAAQEPDSTGACCLEVALPESGSARCSEECELPRVYAAGQVARHTRRAPAPAAARGGTGLSTKPAAPSPRPPVPPKGQEYDLDHHLGNKSALIRELLAEINGFGSSLGGDVTRRIRKQYIGYFRRKRSSSPSYSISAR